MSEEQRDIDSSTERPLQDPVGYGRQYLDSYLDFG